MEPDMPSSSLASLLNDGFLPALDTDNPDPNRIALFPDAISALQSHTFKGVSNFEAAREVAQSLHHNTFATVNAADISNLQAAKDRLHHSDDFLAYVATLHASLSAIPHNSALVGQLLTEFRKVVSDTDAQWARAVPVRWVGMCRHAARLVIEGRDASLALSLVLPLRDAADKLAPAADYLVPVQADFLAVCLEARCYKFAACWLRQHRRLKVDVASTALVGTDVHLIQHYSALIFVGVKSFQDALLCCRLALSVPAPSPGPFYDVVLSTYKLHILLHLLVVGTAPVPLKFSSYASSRMRKATSEYMELAYAFEDRNVKQLHQVVESNRELFEKQGNWGLIKQVVDALTRRLIVRLTNSFMTMKLEDVATKVGLESVEEAHTIISDMVSCHTINASIDDKEGVVRFMDNDFADADIGVLKLSSQYMNDCVSAVQRIEAFREDLERDPALLTKQLKSQQQGRSPSNGGSTGAGSSRMDALEAEWMR